jgi:Uma2 family endonuclease
MVVQPKPHRFTVAEYYKMAEAGIFTEDSRVELIEGEIIEMSPIGPDHASDVIHINHVLTRRLGDLALVSVQNPIRLGNRSEPEPDFAVVRLQPGPGRAYQAAHPTPADVLLVIEIADSSLSYDLGRKARLYARHRIPELWVVDLVGSRLLVHRDPTPRGYATVQILGRGDAVSPLAFPSITFTVDELLG